jgi:hypothetical protein
LRKHRSTLVTLMKAPKKKREEIIRKMDDEVLEVITDVAHNVRQNNTDVKNSPFFRKLKKFRETINFLTSKESNLDIKRNILLHNGRFIKLLLSSIFCSVLNRILDDSV